MHISKVELFRFYVETCDRMHYISHSKVSGIIASLGVYRLGHQVSFREMKRWVQEIEYHVMFIPVFGRKRQIHYLLGKLNEFHMCKYGCEAIGKILLKGYIDAGYFPVVLSKAFVLYTLFGEVGVMTCYHHFFFIYLTMRLIS